MNTVLKQVFEFVEELSLISVAELYRSSWTCVALLRALPPVSSQLVMRLLFLAEPTPKATLLSFVAAGSESVVTKAVSVLLSLRILEEAGNAYVLNSHFQTCLRDGCCVGVLDAWPRQSLSVDKRQPTAQALESYAQCKWEGMLQYIVRPAGARPPSERTLRLLVATGLVDSGIVKGSTSKGFQFLLSDLHAQVWTLFLPQVRASTDGTLLFAFLLQLSFCTVGQDYPIEGLTAFQKEALLDLVDLGFVYIHNEKSRRFYPTYLATHLGLATPSRSSGQAANVMKQGSIIVETNFRVYAHSCSDVQIAVLEVFVELRYKLPNLVVGVLTRDSVRNALLKGIGADLIHSFLRQNAHDIMGGDIPVAVSDQLALWEDERNRLHLQPARMYTSFMSDTDFDKCYKYAVDNDVVLWASAPKRVLCVAESGHAIMAPFIKKYCNV